MAREPVYLRALEPADIVRTLKWHNDATLYESLGGSFRFVGRAAEVAWLKRTCKSAGGEVSLAICVTRGNRHIGNIYLRNTDWIARHAELHMFIGESSARRRGYGLSALRQIITHAFRRMGLQRIYLQVLADNAAAIRTYEKCGFTQEGLMRQHAFKAGRFQDVLVMGLCVPVAEK